MKAMNVLMQVAIFSVLSVTAHAKIYKDIALYYKPTTEISDLKKNIEIGAFRNASIKIGVIKDARKIAPLTRIAENTEDADKVKTVDTQSDVADFVAKNLGVIFGDFGIDVASDKAEYVFDGEVREFFVNETNTYKAKVQIKLSLKKGNKEVWSQVLTGENTRFGRSYKLDNYMETLSDSLIVIVNGVLMDSDFKKVFQTKTGKN